MTARECPVCGGWGFTWSADDVPERCPRECPVPDVIDVGAMRDTPDAA